MIDVDTYRHVTHRITLSLDGDDQYDAETSYRGESTAKRFKVDSVVWPQRYTAATGLPTPATRVTISGPAYRMDGTLGRRRGSITVAVSDLPDAVARALLEAGVQVYRP